MIQGRNGGQSRSYRALRESEELHRATLGSISDAVFITDDEGGFTYICPNVDVIFGYVPDEVLAMGNISRLLGATLFDHAELAARREIRNLECEVLSRLGERRTVLVHVKRVAIQNGTVLYTCRDVTERKQAEEALRTTRFQLTHASRLALLGELMASIVHEIRQPLSSMLAYVDTGERLVSEGDNGDRVREIFGGVRSQVNATAEIVGRLQSLVRKQPFELRGLGVNGIVRDVLLLTEADARRRNIRLATELTPDLPVVDGDRVSLQQVVMNLLVNAMDAMNDIDREQRRLTVSTHRSGDAVEVAVADSGGGIADEDLPKLFDPFFTTKETGIGLGLSISRSIIEAHNGRIWADNRTEGGATFRFSLPRQNRPIEHTPKGSLRTPIS